MNKEILNEQLTNSEAKSPDVKIFASGALSVEQTAENLISLLQKMYVEHGITKNKEKLVNDIKNRSVLTWFAQKDGTFIATASLIKQSDGSWELGRAVSLDRGNGIGKRVILEALKFHLENHGSPLTAEVRAAVDFMGIPGGGATQKIFFGTVNKILPLTPFAVAPLFSHGNPLRNEQFILSSSNVTSARTLSERMTAIINGRSTKGSIPRLSVVQEVPFRLVLPDDSGKPAKEVIGASQDFNGCSLFPVEVTDRNMPLIGVLSANPDMIFCGVDRVNSKEGKPVIMIATLGFAGNIGTGESNKLAPTKVSEVLPLNLRNDIQEIANRFESIHSKKAEKLRNDHLEFWKFEMNWPR